MSDDKDLEFNIEEIEQIIAPVIYQDIGIGGDEEIGPGDDVYDGPGGGYDEVNGARPSRRCETTDFMCGGF